VARLDQSGRAVLAPPLDEEDTVGQDNLAKLLSVVRDSISRLESSATNTDELRVLHRALAHLWSAHDELEALSTRRWGQSR
jgi:hypothetical protein